MIRPNRHNDALVATIGYDYSYHKCPVGNDGILQTRKIGVRDFRSFSRSLYGLVNRRNLSAFGGHIPGSLMLTGFSSKQGIWSVDIRKPNYDENSQLVTSGFLHHAYPLADFTPLEVFLP